MTNTESTESIAVVMAEILAEDEGLYQISNFGRVKNFRGCRTKILRETLVNGYINCGLYDKNLNLKTWHNHIY